MQAPPSGVAAHAVPLEPLKTSDFQQPVAPRFTDPRAAVELLRAGMQELTYYWNPQHPLGPLSLRAGIFAELVLATRRLSALLLTAALRSGANSAERHAQLGLPVELLQLYGPDDIESRYANWQVRPDAVLTPKGIRFIEVNSSCSAGGMSHVYHLNRAWQRLYPGLNEFGADPFRARLNALERVWREHGLPRSVVILEEPRSLIPEESIWTSQVKYLRAQGVAALSMQVEDFIRVGAPAGVAIKHFVPQDRLDLGLGLDGLGHNHGLSGLWLAPQSSYLVSNKQTLAWLSEGLPWMTLQDREFVQKYVPWSRVVGRRRTTFRGRDWELPELLTTHRKLFVLKPAASYGGRDVLIGLSADDVTWQARITDALRDGRWIVQERVDSVDLQMPMWDVAKEQQFVSAVTGVISPFVVDGEDAGCFVRYDLHSRSGIVHVRNPSVRFNTVVGG